MKDRKSPALHSAVPGWQLNGRAPRTASLPLRKNDGVASTPADIAALLESLASLVCLPEFTHAAKACVSRPTCWGVRRKAARVQQALILEQRRAIFPGFALVIGAQRCRNQLLRL